MENTPHKSGFVSIIGKPNAGKSTLMNAFLGQKLSITTNKPQTTRHAILGILSEDDYQIVFTDTPGVIRPQYGMQKAMMKFITKAIEATDVVVLLIDVNEQFPEGEMLNMIKSQAGHLPKILALNKIDEATEELVKERRALLEGKMNFVKTVEISALKNTQLDELLQEIINNLPESPPYFDKDSLSDRPERFFISEIIREKLFILLHDEIPYSCEVRVMEFKEVGEALKISAEIHVDRRTHKGMIIGKNGSMIKKIKIQSRRDMERFLDQKVNLELYVRITEGWKDDNRRLKEFGYR